MSARRQIIAALSEDSLGGIATLADVAHAEQLVDAYRAEVLAEAKVEVVAWLVKKDRENTPIGHLASKVDRGAVRIFLGTGHYHDAMDAHRTEVLAKAADYFEQRRPTLAEVDTDFQRGRRATVGWVVEELRDWAKAREKATASAATATPDTLAEWLYVRFVGHERWNKLAEDDRAYWEHEARAVRRAVQRGGFRTATPAEAAE